jgi:Spy/CpxP family protein refolding chaperone
MGGGERMRDRSAMQSPEDMLFERLAGDGRIAQELGLTTNQTESLRKVGFELKQKLIDLNAQREKAGLQQAQLMTAPDPDEAAVMKAVEESGAIQTEIAKLRVKQVMAARKILTPEQQQKAREMIRAHMEARRAEMGGQGGMGSGAGRRGQRQPGGGQPAMPPIQGPDQPGLPPPPPPPAE